MQTLSEEYRELNRKMHESRASYGVSGHYHAPLLLRGAREYGVGAVLDYGCGKGTLAPVLRTNGLECFEYDPAIPGKDTPPAPADMVYSGDVAEHVEPEYLDAYLDDLRRLTKKVVVLLIATRPAKKTLADGRNAHLIQEPLEWWLPKLAARFQMTQLLADPEGFSFVGTPLPLGDTA